MTDEDKTHKKNTHKKYYKIYDETNKEKVISKPSEKNKKQCNICNSLITRNKMNRHQETEMCNKKSL